MIFFFLLFFLIKYSICFKGKKLFSFVNIMIYYESFPIGGLVLTELLSVYLYLNKLISSLSQQFCSKSIQKMFNVQACCTVSFGECSEKDVHLWLVYGLSHKRNLIFQLHSKSLDVPLMCELCSNYNLIFFVVVLLSAHIETFSVCCMQNFLDVNSRPGKSQGMLYKRCCH